MNSRLQSITVVVALTLASAASSVALERTVERVGSDESPWRGGDPCTVTYYNTCVGWVWTWSGWSAGEIIGVQYDPCCAPGETASLASFAIAAGVTVPVPSGYGFTGSIDVWTADENDCPTGFTLSSTPYLPVHGFTTIDYTTTGGVEVGGPFVITFTAGSGGLPPTAGFRTDFDAAGPTGPTACGTCYPTTRESNSYYYGTTVTAICPGSTLSVICEVEWQWSVAMNCGTTSVTQNSWGAIKGLYR
jgi:hypothetical protein